MADEPRRSGRATKGQHTKTASTSPPPQPKEAKPPNKPKSKKKKSPRDQPDATESYDDDGDEEQIRCICGDDNPKDKRPFIGCEACSVWQHNICMGMPDDEDELGDHYWCEQCQPKDHRETLAALENDEKIWETRNKIWQNEKKAGSKRKSKSGGPAGWLKKELADSDDAAEMKEEEEEKKEDQESVVGSKRKREAEASSTPQDIKAEPEEKAARGSRQDKRRKPTANGAASADPETALVDIDNLPESRKKAATVLSKIIADDAQTRSQARSFRIPDGHTAKSLGDHHAARIEYALTMNHEGPENPAYGTQFRALNANLKKNKLLIERLLNGSLTADELSTMESKDMASEELQRENARLKEAADRQAVAVQEEGPRYRHTHKGVELIEDENAISTEAARSIQAQPVRERLSVAEGGSPPAEAAVAARQSQSQTAPEHRRTSSQQFDMDNIWAKTAQSPTTGSAPRPMQQPPRRRSSIKPQHSEADAVGGTKEDADVDRMLQDDDDEDYSPAEYSDGIVWRGKLIQSADAISPTVNARFVAGRDLTSTVSWRDLLPAQLSIDGRLQIPKAEEYLCSLQWSQSSDVSVLALTPHDDADGFEAIFNYFKSRERYAVVNKDKPLMVKDLYIIPVDKGQEVPNHVGMLEFNRLGSTVEEKCLLASFVVGRSTETAPVAPGNNQQQQQQQPADSMAANGSQHALPQHLRGGGPGPAGSPINMTTPTFSAPPTANPLINEILGNLQYTPTAQQVIAADPSIPREKLLHLRNILLEDPNTQTDISALATRLQ
ncbi:hypothetical protein BDY17DRAFT_308858 [Neohortaea acidophila]|uniref:Transcription factor BYE1 n=1 Tax=Neohortaea acidophila TaxID=245834 RepID=A0A6A6PZP6_9PEZI|nr:uncharacterized protein BDY17DRAFT_308858 [Neohortaea acidophila]KAF2485492.1 hypothetical protein BDY17DRAFT_308858 [Neohortaea acidophila]